MHDDPNGLCTTVFWVLALPDLTTFLVAVALGGWLSWLAVVPKQRTPGLIRWGKNLPTMISTLSSVFHRVRGSILQQQSHFAQVFTQYICKAIILRLNSFLWGHCIACDQGYCLSLRVRFRCHLLLWRVLDHQSTLLSESKEKVVLLYISEHRLLTLS